jgi:predicted tellurium resistance membrane protein TerC
MDLYRRRVLLGLILVVSLGLMAKFYQGVGQAWVNDAFGGIPYVVFWMLLVAWLFPRSRPRSIALGVLGATCFLEWLQLWQPSWLQAIRATLPGQLVLGNTFVWSDFLYYVFGSALGWLMLRSLRGPRGELRSASHSQE